MNLIIAPEILKIFADEPWLILCVSLVIFTVLAHAISRFFDFIDSTIAEIGKRVTILIRGYPPQHCDADGDFADDFYDCQREDDNHNQN